MGLYFILFFRTSDSSAQPPAHVLALNCLIIPGFTQVNSRISVPADRAVLSLYQEKVVKPLPVFSQP